MPPKAIQAVETQLDERIATVETRLDERIAALGELIAAVEGKLRVRLSARL